jgi:hypothetical protein
MLEFNRYKIKNSYWDQTISAIVSNTAKKAFFTTLLDMLEWDMF